MNKLAKIIVGSVVCGIAAATTAILIKKHIENKREDYIVDEDITDIIAPAPEVSDEISEGLPC